MAFGTVLADEERRSETDWDERAAGGAAGHDRITFILESGGVPSGMATGVPADDDPQGAELVGVWVDPAARGVGGGAALVEQVIAWDPEFIFVASDPAGEMNVYQHITESGDWSILQAVRSGQVYQIPHGPFDWLDRPYSVARILGIQWVGDLLYPDLWDVDIEETTKEFYRLFYHYELSDTEYETLTKDAFGSD